MNSQGGCMTFQAAIMQKNRIERVVAAWIDHPMTTHYPDLASILSLAKDRLVVIFDRGGGSSNHPCDGEAPDEVVGCIGFLQGLLAAYTKLADDKCSEGLVAIHRLDQDD